VPYRRARRRRWQARRARAHLPLCWLMLDRAPPGRIRRRETACSRGSHQPAIGHPGRV
jgi:hypothetical protein